MFRCIGEWQESQGSTRLWDIMQNKEAGVRGGLEAKSEVGESWGPPQISDLSNKQDAIHL